MEDLQESKVASLEVSGARLEDGTEIQWDACGSNKYFKWHIGSTVYYLKSSYPIFTCWDEFEEGDWVQGTYQSHGMYIVFLDPNANRYYAIPKAKIKSQGNDFPDQGPGFIIRINKVLWLRFNEEPVAPFPIDHAKCPICLSASEGGRNLQCGHVVHVRCLEPLIRSQKVFRCPVYLCRKPLPGDLISQILQI